MKSKKNIILLALSLLLPMFHSCEKKPQTVEQRLEYWKDLRFGMFIHWGPVSLKGTEIGWSRGREIPVEEYDNLYLEFNPVNFDADAWVQLAKDAGMKYIIFTSKHHDGFCMWDTKYNDYNIMNSPFKRDVMLELAEACKNMEWTLDFTIPPATGITPIFHLQVRGAASNVRFQISTVILNILKTSLWKS
jgi:hypothetical protein